ncbi:MAG: lysozyme inhibitor LprI family protein [Deltaproteobacteria bacterium]
MPLSKFIFAAALFTAVTPAAAQEPAAADCSEALSTVEMNNCAGAEFEKADAELNRVYAKALAAVPGLATDETPFDAKSWEASLRASQRTWLAFRDAECEEHVAKFWGGGTGATVDILGCKTEKTEQRTKELKQRYEIE